MKTRRDFFRQFIGQVGVLRDDLRGVKNIPLNRLNELPDNIIEQIEPIFFPDEIWYLENNNLKIPGRSGSDTISIEMGDIEVKALSGFRKGRSIKQVVDEIRKETGLLSDDIYRIVKCFFLKLASNRICHPREVRNIEDILTPDR